jgi:hypothetical protein
MRESNWQYKDKDQIIDLILDHNAGIERLTGELRRRAKGHLDNMNAAELWRHVMVTYGGKLYEPDVAPVSELELRRREYDMNKVRVHKSASKPAAEAAKPVEYAPIEDAHNAIYSKNCVKKVFRYGDQLVVVMEDACMTGRLTKWVARKFPNINITIISGQE